jgi:hypothetical protein
VLVDLAHSSYSLKYLSSKGGGVSEGGGDVGVEVDDEVVLYNKYLNGSDIVYKKLYGRWVVGWVGVLFIFL